MSPSHKLSPFFDLVDSHPLVLSMWVNYELGLMKPLSLINDLLCCKQLNLSSTSAQVNLVASNGKGVEIEAS